MLDKEQCVSVMSQVKEIIQKSKLNVTNCELMKIQVTDFGLGDLKQYGAQIITLSDTDLIGVKLIVLLPDQILPEHYHPRVDEYMGKQEIVRGEWGQTFVYDEGTANDFGKQRVSSELENYTAFNETLLGRAEQLLIEPRTKHWFMGGPEGSIIWSFSSKVLDKNDVFTNKSVKRDSVSFCKIEL